MDSTQEVRVIHLPNLLATRLGGQPGEDMMEELLRNAESKVQELAADYLAVNRHGTCPPIGVGLTPGRECELTKTRRYST